MTVVWQDGVVLDDSTRRLLRFSLFLQGFAFLMMGATVIIYSSAFGWTTISWILLAVLVLIAGAAIWTVRRLRAG